MSSPSRYGVAQSVLLNYAIGAMQNQSNFLARRVLPLNGISGDSGIYWTYNQPDWLKFMMKKRAEGNDTPVVEYGATKQTIAIEQYELATGHSFEFLDKADSMLNTAQNDVNYLTQQDAVQLELLLSELLFTASKWTGSKTGSDVAVGTAFDATGGAPIEFLRGIIQQVKSKTGFAPNMIVCGGDVDNAIQLSEECTDRLKYTSAKSVTRDMIQSFVFPDGNGTYAVSDAVYTASGASSSSLVFSGGKIWVGYVQPGLSANLPTAIAGFYDSTLRGGSNGVAMDTYDDVKKKMSYARITTSRAMARVATDLGVLCTGCLAS